MAPEPNGPQPPPAAGGPSPPSRARLPGRRGGDRERRLIVRIAELERRIEQLQAEAARDRARALELSGEVTRLAARADRLDWIAAPGLEDLHVPAGGRTGLSGSGTTSRVLCSGGTGPDTELLSITGAGLAAYAWRWGWDLLLSGENGGDPAVVRKLRLIRELCDSHAWVLWLDPAAALVDASADVLAETRPERDLYVSAAVDGEPVAARAVTLVRSSDWSRQLLDRLITAPDTEIGVSRYDELPAEWAWRPGDGVGRGPFVLLGEDATPQARRAAALERLAMLRRGASGAPGALGPGAPAPLTAFGPSHAAEVPALLHSLGLTGRAVVVGPAPDGFCEGLAEAWCGERVMHIHPSAVPGTGPGSHRVGAWAISAEEGAERFAAEELDAVWLLGAGSELEITRQLMTWWPLVRPGGLLLGHPYTDTPLPEGAPASRGPVDWFFGELGLPVHATPGDAPRATWMVRKPPSDDGGPLD